MPTINEYKNLLEILATAQEEKQELTLRIEEGEEDLKQIAETEEAIDTLVNCGMMSEEDAQSVFSHLGEVSTKIEEEYDKIVQAYCTICMFLGDAILLQLEEEEKEDDS